MNRTHPFIPELTETEQAKFWSKVASPNEHGCRLWIPTNDSQPTEDRYGKFYIRRATGKGNYGKNYRAHRVAYFLHTGKQPGVLMVCHNCPGGDNPRCCAGEHLFLATSPENTKDAQLKGRMAKGARNGMNLHPEKRPKGRVLTEESVRDLRAMRKEGVRYKTLGPLFGIAPYTARLICNGHRWKHVK